MIRVEYDHDQAPARTGPHGSPTNPHVVTSAASLRCTDCGDDLGAVLTGRLVAALAPAGEVAGG